MGLKNLYSEKSLSIGIPKSIYIPHDQLWVGEEEAGGIGCGGEPGFCGQQWTCREGQKCYSHSFNKVCCTHIWIKVSQH